MPPIGSFFVKATLCYVLGLINKDAYAAIDKLAGVRNDFAHLTGAVEITHNDVPPASMFHPDVLAAWRKMHQPLMDYARHRGESKGFSEPRYEFMANVSAIYHYLYARIDWVKQIHLTLKSEEMPSRLESAEQSE
jgi:hypothetical protein